MYPLLSWGFLGCSLIEVGLYWVLRSAPQSRTVLLCIKLDCSCRSCLCLTYRILWSQKECIYVVTSYYSIYILHYVCRLFTGDVWVASIQVFIFDSHFVICIVKSFSILRLLAVDPSPWTLDSDNGLIQFHCYFLVVFVYFCTAPLLDSGGGKPSKEQVCKGLYQLGQSIATPEYSSW